MISIPHIIAKTDVKKALINYWLLLMVADSIAFRQISRCEGPGVFMWASHSHLTKSVGFPYRKLPLHLYALLSSCSYLLSCRSASCLLLGLLILRVHTLSCGTGSSPKYIQTEFCTLCPWSTHFSATFASLFLPSLSTVLTSYVISINKINLLPQKWRVLVQISPNISSYEQSLWIGHQPQDIFSLIRMNHFFIITASFSFL